MVRARPPQSNPFHDRADTSAKSDHTRALRLWLLCVAAMIFLTLVVGGATRLTESGLSITQWKPLTGVLPPLSDAAWQAEFKDYQAIPQYKQLNRGMSLDEFKVIYWWEWAHRLLARSTGAVFLLPFLVFLWRGAVPPRLAPAAVDDLRRRRFSRAGRLVDGVVGSRGLRPRQRRAGTGSRSISRSRPRSTPPCCGPRSRSRRSGQARRRRGCATARWSSPL